MATQERIIELVDDKGMEISTTLATSELTAKAEDDYERLSTKSDHLLNYESGNSLHYEDEEDVPSDFFDDFSNQDFMAGLDVVDVWDDEEITDEKEKTKKTDEAGPKSRNKERARRRRSRSPIRLSDIRRRNYDRRRSRDRRRPSSRDRNKRKSMEKPKDKPKKEELKDKPKKEELKDKPKKEELKEEKKRADKETKEDGGSDELAPDHRRDPEKTKRDIQKDKDKCTKDKEAKIISEKLKVVETGLVPPGTEMEVDLKLLKTAVDKEQEKKSPPKSNHRQEKRRRSTSVEIFRSRVTYKERRYSPRRSSRSRERSYEHRYQYRRSRSPYRGRSRSRSPVRRKMSSERRIYLEERKRIRSQRDAPSTVRRNSKNRSLALSPVSNVSEREMWLRQRDRQHLRNLSCSPISDTESGNRRKSRDFLEELASKLKSDKKKSSFLKEIHERLNEPSKPPNFAGRCPAPGPVPTPIIGPNSIPTMPGHGHIPPGFMPTAPPGYYQPRMDPNPQYDQQFFIGQPDMFHNPNPYQQPFMGLMPGPGAMPGELFGAPSTANNVIVAHPVDPSNNYNVNIVNIQQATEMRKEQDKEVITKLFEDKKISLSDFLSMSAKHADPAKPVNVQKKIKGGPAPWISKNLRVMMSERDKARRIAKRTKVADHWDYYKSLRNKTAARMQREKLAYLNIISLCQDAVKALGGDSKLSGRFFLKKTARDVEKSAEIKFQSPLRKIPVVRFNFTTPSKTGDDKSSLQSTLSKLLASLGLIEAPPPVVPKPLLSPVTSESSVKSVPIRQTITPIKTTVRNGKKYDPILGVKKYDPILGAKFQMKMCQTDPMSCHICEIRKSRKFVDKSVQCETSTVDSGTQITDEDLQRLGIKSPVKNVLKNQSLAYLTPAQLLGRTAGEEESPKMDIFPAARMLTPPPPEISPERQNVRASLSNNDSFPNRSEYPDRYQPDPFSNQSKPNRSGAHKLPSIFDKMIPNPFNKRPANPFDTSSRPSSFETGSRPNSFESGTHPRPNPFDNRPKSGVYQESIFSSPHFNQRMQEEDEDDFEPAHSNYGGNSNKRQFIPPNRGNFKKPGSYAGRNFY